MPNIFFPASPAFAGAGFPFSSLAIYNQKTGVLCPTIAPSLPKPTNFFKAFLKDNVHFNAILIGSFVLPLAEVKIAMLP
jgi:hypothetical protein